VYLPVVADSRHFNEEHDPDLHYSEKSDPDLDTDPHDPDPHFSDAAAQP
jgi:hypothetical protein